jgi:phosphoribosylamine--glycine ligase
LTRDYAHYPPSLVGPTFDKVQFPDPCSLLRERKVDLVVPMSIDWAQAAWNREFLEMNIPILSPVRAGMLIERERDFARRLCRQYKIPFPEAHSARNRLEAEQILRRSPRPYVVKNPLCSPNSPIHTIVCESVEDTRSWLPHLDYAEGVFLQEYLGRAEVGHIALISGGEVYSLVTNQEYKRAFNGNMGIVAGAPLGGVVEQDPEDRYGLARNLLHPLLPWFREVHYAGPVQVTAVQRQETWHVIEYNIRLGVTSGPMILRLLRHPLQTLLDTAHNRKLDLQFRHPVAYGCSVTLAGYGYPYTQVTGPRLPVELETQPDCDLWWNEVALGPDGRLYATGHRVADVVAIAATLEQAVARAYANIKRIRCLGSYYRTDVGASLWPPGTG